MRMPVAALALICAANLFGQRGRHFSWQDACFKNPGLPYCQGRDYAVKNPPPKKDNPRSAVTNPSAPASGAANPSLIVISADPQLPEPVAQIAETALGQHLSALVDLIRLLSSPSKSN